MRMEHIGNNVVMVDDCLADLAIRQAGWIKFWDNMTREERLDCMRQAIAYATSHTRNHPYFVALGQHLEQADNPFNALTYLGRPSFYVGHILVNPSGHQNITYRLGDTSFRMERRLDAAIFAVEWLVSQYSFPLTGQPWRVTVRVEDEKGLMCRIAHGKELLEEVSGQESDVSDVVIHNCIRRITARYAERYADLNLETVDMWVTVKDLLAVAILNGASQIMVDYFTYLLFVEAPRQDCIQGLKRHAAWIQDNLKITIR